MINMYNIILFIILASICFILTLTIMLAILSQSTKIIIFCTNLSNISNRNNINQDIDKDYDQL